MYTIFVLRQIPFCLSGQKAKRFHGVKLGRLVLPQMATSVGKASEGGRADGQQAAAAAAGTYLGGNLTSHNSRARLRKEVG
jgi:hypothetical protein